MKLFLFTTLFTAFLYSCKDALTTVSIPLYEVEDCMKLHPNIALKILQEISHSGKLHTKSLTDYALLTVQPLEKNDPSLESNTLRTIEIGSEKGSMADPAIFNEIEVIGFEEKYRNEKLKNKKLQTRNTITNAILGGVIMVMLVFFVVFYYHHRITSNRRKIKEIELFIAHNEDEIIEYKQELSVHTNHETENQNIMDELKGKIALLTNQNRKLTEQVAVLGYDKSMANAPDQDLYLGAFRTIISMKSGTKRKLSEYDRTSLIKLFNFLYNDYAIRLKKEFDGITKHEIELCCLLRLGFTNRELCDVYNTALESVSKSKSRLKARLKVPNGQTLEAFLAGYS